MAQKRRGGGGFRPPELRGTLGTLLRTALHQAGGVRDALEGAARQGRSRLDTLRADRRRQDALAELGEIVLDLVRRGEIDPDELPEAREVILHLEELEAEVDGPPHDVATPPVRRRFDERTPPPRGRAADDGTVSSGARWSPPQRAAPARVWRPPADEDAMPAAETARTSRIPTLPKDPHRKGGISFEDDDLAEYMHPDDVPAKDAPQDPAQDPAQDPEGGDS